MILLFPIYVWAQQPHSEQFTRFQIYGGKHYNERQLRELIGLPKRDGSTRSRVTSDQLNRKLQSLLEIYRADGYLAAAIDSVLWPQDSHFNSPVQIYLSEGQPFKVNQLEILGNKHFTEQEIRESISLAPGAIFKSNELGNDVQKIIDLYTEEGYLLVKVAIEDLAVRFEVALVEIVLNITEGGPVRVRDVEVVGNHTTRTNVVIRELGVGQNSLLTKARLSQIPDRLRRLSYIELTDAPEITFTPDSTAVITLSIREENSSQFNGIVGFNPKQGSQDAFVNGLVDLSFQNLLGSGRSFLAYWQKRDSESQSLRLGYEEPWLFGWPINGAIGLEQIIQDTSYVRRSWHFGLKVFAFENIALAAQVGRESVLPDSIARVIHQLPKSRADRVNLQIELDSRNHAWNPSGGVMYRTGVDFIRKRIDPLTTDGRMQKKDFRRVSLDLEYLLPFFRRQVMMFGLHGRKVSIGKEVITVDELFRLGGASDLRGYREDQFLGSQVAWGTVEYRILLDRNSRVGFFVDGAYIGRKIENEQWLRQYRIGYGVGVRTRTDLGLIGFDYALGKGDNFSQGKIHIRLINTF